MYRGGGGLWAEEKVVFFASNLALKCCMFLRNILLISDATCEEKRVKPNLLEIFMGTHLCVSKIKKKKKKICDILFLF